MANSLNIDLTGKVVVLRADRFDGDEKARRFVCTGGYGCSPRTMGRAIIGRFLCDGEEARVEGTDVEKLSDDQSKEPG